MFVGLGRVRGWHCTSRMGSSHVAHSFLNSKPHVPNPICSNLPNLLNPVKPCQTNGFKPFSNPVKPTVSNLFKPSQTHGFTPVKPFQTLSNPRFQTFQTVSNLFKPSQSNDFQTFQTLFKPFSNPFKPFKPLSNLFQIHTSVWGLLQGS